MDFHAGQGIEHFVHDVKAVVFIDETLYDEAFLKKIFTGATPHHKYNSSSEFLFINVVFILIKENNV